MADYHLTPNFKLSEFLVSGCRPPNSLILNHLTMLANRLQVIRDILGKPIRVISGYRTPEHNAEIGGETGSYHTKGMAADIVIDGMSPKEVQRFLEYWSGGLGSYDGHTHVDIRPFKARWSGKSK